jgi:DNA repair exonuclease SbcCD ATPase subunit
LPPADPSQVRYHLDVTKLVPQGEQAEREFDRLRARVVELEASCGRRAAEADAVKAGLEAFRRRYHEEVGLLHEQLDELEAAIAEAELGELASRIDAAADGHREPPPVARPEPLPRFTSDAIRKLFRDVAKTIHPDLALDQSTRERRHALMVEANRAYVRGDEAQLRWILEAWKRSPEAVQGRDADALRLQLERRIQELEDQLHLLDRDLATLKETPLWQLKVMVDQAATRGRDIVRDMVERLKRDIMVATNRLEAMRPPSHD